MEKSGWRGGKVSPFHEKWRAVGNGEGERAVPWGCRCVWGSAGESLHLVTNEPLTGSGVLISSVCFHRPLRVHSTIVLLGRPCRRSQALGPLFVKRLPCFFFSVPRIHRAKYNLSFLLGQSLALWQTVVLNYIGIRDIGGVSHCFNLLWLWSNECNANRM